MFDKTDTKTRALAGIIGLSLIGGSAAFAGIPLASAQDSSDSAAAAGTDGESAKDNWWNRGDYAAYENLGHHSYQTSSALDSSFKIRNSEKLKGVWSTPAEMGTFKVHNNWKTVDGYAYLYWYQTFAKDGSWVYASGGDAEGDFTVSEQQADEAFKYYVEHFDWSKVELKEDGEKDTKPAAGEKGGTTASFNSYSKTTVNGWTALSYDGTIERGSKSYTAHAYVVIDGDTASWNIVASAEPKSNSNLVKTVAERSKMAACSFRDGADYRSSGGTMWDYHDASADSDDGTMVSVDENGTTVLDDTGAPAGGEA